MEERRAVKENNETFAKIKNLHEANGFFVR